MSDDRSEKTKKYAKVGGLVLGACALLVGLVVVIGGSSWWTDRNEYYVESTETVSGLTSGAPVCVLGVPTGRVESVELAGEDRNRVRVTFELPEDLTVREGAKARFERQGISELKNVNIIPGPSDAAPIEPGGQIPLEDTPLQAIFDNAEEVSERAAAVLESVDQLAQRIDAALASIVGGGDGELRDRAGAIAAQVEDTLAQAETTLEDLEGLIETSAPPLEETLDNAADITESVEDGLEETQGLKGELRAVMADARELLESLERAAEMNDSQLRETLVSLEEAGERVEGLASQLQRDPNQLIFSDPPEPRELPR